MKIALVIFITLAGGLCAVITPYGVIPVPWRALLTDWQAGREHYYVLMEYRLPRLLLALFVGAALAVAGVLIQGIVRNPLASPDILGVNHAASGLCGALLLMPSLPVMVLPLLAFAGGMAGLILLKMLARPPADEAGAHRRGAFCMLGQPDGLSDALAPAGCEQRPAVADRQLMGP
ncbi:hypothetical protein ECZU38_27250 [Escherichia coli]|nr:hypothetical protein ECZU38_27250 [Escherichia coli]